MSDLFLKDFYTKTVVPELTKSQGYQNVHQVPKITKITLNSGFDSSTDKTTIQNILQDIERIAGQKPVITKARTSISNFKLREGMPLGVKVTLRGQIMWEFLYKLIAVVLPNIRDFRGIGKRFDGNGNYTLGVKDHSIFPEINIENNKQTVGLDLTIVTTATTDEEGLALLTSVGLPFRKSTGDADETQDAEN